MSAEELLRVVADVTASECRPDEKSEGGHAPGEGCIACDIYHRIMGIAEASGMKRP